ncbi:MAG: hypothetical protein HOP17_01510 [Acidobacteria bacterium]|nr:hypothetical protein [Acidobacteriota bacterium]
MKRIFIGFLIVSFCLSIIGCGSSPSPNSNTTAAEKVCDPISDTPTEAYKRLFAAVKEKSPEKIKGEMSTRTQEFAESIAARQKSPIEKVYVNAFTATTFAPTLPEMRDERTKGCWGALEVRNDKDGRWEDLPFINEGGFWKFAMGEMFGGSYKSPGKGMDEKEKEAANVARGNAPPVNMMGNMNVNGAANVNTKVPKYDGPQVEPLPKKK